MGLW